MLSIAPSNGNRLNRRNRVYILVFLVAALGHRGHADTVGYDWTSYDPNHNRVVHGTCSELAADFDVVGAPNAYQFRCTPGVPELPTSLPQSGTLDELVCTPTCGAWNLHAYSFGAGGVAGPLHIETSASSCSRNVKGGVPVSRREARAYKRVPNYNHFTGYDTQTGRYVESDPIGPFHMETW